jgi:lactate dehydrogenase-like 2-hydroxyacid dehydrogenase
LRPKGGEALASSGEEPSMSKKKPLVVVTRKLPAVVETRMRELFDARLNIDDTPMSQAALVEAVKTADVLVPTVTDRIDAGIIAQAGDQLRLIANFGNGVDNIDVASAVQRGITVTNTPGVLTDDTADMTIALILAVARRIAEGARVIPDDEWAGWSPTWMLGRRITGKRLGIVGMGRIGQAVARAPPPSACRSTIITAAASMPASRRSSTRPIGIRSTRCWRGWTSSRSTARIRRRPITCSRPAD